MHLLKNALSAPEIQCDTIISSPERNITNPQTMTLFAGIFAAASIAHAREYKLHIAFATAPLTPCIVRMRTANGANNRRLHISYTHTYEGDSCVTYKCFSPFRGLHNIFKCARVAVCFIDVVILAGAVWPRARRVF